MEAPTEPTATTTPSLIPDSQPLSSQLDNEIATIRAQISTLTHHRSLLRSTLLTSAPTQSHLTHPIDPFSQFPPKTTTTTTTTTALHHATTHQAAHNTLTLHRLCAGATMFRVRDPDPHALDSGRVYGVRIEVFCDVSLSSLAFPQRSLASSLTPRRDAMRANTGRFLTPYYLLLHRPHAGSAALRVHRHTLPPCVPLSALVARWLPLPKTLSAGGGGGGGGGGGDADANVESGKAGRERVLRQDLPRLVRELRREIVGWHLRGAWVGRLRDAVKEGGVDREMRRGRCRYGIREVEATDAERLEVRIEWVDGRVGRVRVGKGGRVERAVVLGESGRERGVERRLCGGEGRMEGLASRLGEVSAVA